VAKAIAGGLRVDIRAPLYTDATWRGYRLNNPQVYPGWVTPEEHPSIVAAVDAYTRVAARKPRVARWIFSTDGVGFPTRTLDVPPSKRWIQDGDYRYPAMFGIGPGVEQNTHKIGENVDSREFDTVIAFLARFPSVYDKVSRNAG
jgi:acetylornithine deacetylase/succinyl-diaminopimelate desuccinylase-like protein